uniref:Ferric-chelate reductase 1 n=1 Tax=Knipowitschia caucasica TaxID=637954 RepID=A0AAV2JN04_KNICA
MCPGHCGIMESSLLPLLGTVLACVLGVGGYSNGRVEVSCTDMQPRHRSSPQTTPPPFTLSTDRVDYSAGEDVTVNLLAPSSSHFEGFLLQARVLGSESVAGSFLSAPSGTQRLSCGGSPNSALSHSSSSEKSSVQVTWRPAADQDVHFYATIVQNITVYWVAVASPRVRFSSGSNSTGGTSSLEPANTTVPSSAVSSMMTTAPLGITVEGCGASRLCFRQPPDCDPAQEPAACFFMSAMVLSPGSSAVHYQLSGPSPGYIAFGFSDDRNMGNDDIYICVEDASGRVQLQHAFSSGATTPDTVPLGSVWDIRTSLAAGVISCSFSTTNSISTQRSSQRHYLLYAHGPSSNGQVQMHSGTFVSADTVDVSSPGQELRTYRPLIIKAHGETLGL